MDLRIIENGNGGDLVFANGDIETTSEVYNQPYLAHFGGNKDVSEDNGLHVDFWGNTLLLPNNEQFISEFERAINTIPLSSSGRVKLETAAKKDLEYLSGFATTNTVVSITGVDKIKLMNKIMQGNNKNFAYIWDTAKDQILEE